MGGAARRRPFCVPRWCEPVRVPARAHAGPAPALSPLLGLTATSWPSWSIPGTDGHAAGAPGRIRRRAWPLMVRSWDERPHPGR